MPPKRFETSLTKASKPEEAQPSYLREILIGVGIGLLALLALAGMIVAINTSFFASLLNGFINFFALNTKQQMWYLMRAAGITAYVLLWLTTAWGLAVASKIFDNLLHRSFIFNFHEFIALLSLGFLALHIFTLLADQYLPFSLLQILVPFIAPYRSFWVGFGTLAFYILVIVTASCYLKKKIGQKAFRTLHVFTLLGYLSALGHAFFAGTDSTLPATIIMYAGTSLVIIFLFAYWLLTRSQSKATASQKVSAGRVQTAPVKELD